MSDERMRAGDIATGRRTERQSMSDDRRPDGARSPAERMRAGDIATGRRKERH
jgi:hypothetical protein